MADLFLNPDELAILTGRKRKSTQVEQLRKMGIPFFVNAANAPVVTRATIEGRTGEEAKPEPVWKLDIGKVR